MSPPDPDAGRQGGGACAVELVHPRPGDPEQARHRDGGVGGLAVVRPRALAPVCDSSHGRTVNPSPGFASSLHKTYRSIYRSIYAASYEVTIHLSFCETGLGLNNRHLPHGRRKREDYGRRVRRVPGQICPVHDWPVFKCPPRSRAKGLVPKTSDGKGRVVWQWQVGSNTTPGRWPIKRDLPEGRGPRGRTDEFRGPVTWDWREYR